MAAAPLTPEARERLRRLLGMLGSDHAGERANAAKLADEHIRRLGLRWSDVLAWTPAARSSPPPPPPPPPAPWRDMVETCLTCPPGLFNAREHEFLADMQRWRGAPTEKQLHWLEALFDRYRHATAP